MKPTFRPLAAAPILAGLVSMVASSQAFAQDAPPVAPASTAPAADSKPDAVEDLIHLLVLRKSITQEEADVLIAKLHASQQTAPAAAATPAAPTAPPVPAAAAAQPETPPADKSKIRVMYIPESEKQKIRSEIKDQVIEQAKAENWAQPWAMPDWLKRFTFDGDFRFRQEFDLYDSNNDPDLINFNAINGGSPLDESGLTTPALPLLNSTQDREVPRFRLQLGISAAVADGLSANFRIASGNTVNPVSTNQTVGSDFDNYSVVIEKAYLQYQPADSLTLWLGRMPKPWQSTPLVWWDDLSFDGFAGHYVYSVTPFIKPFLTAGAFSVENTAGDFPSTSPDKVASRDKWLFGAQLGVDWKYNRRLKSSTAVAFYDFYHLEGAVSSPCLAVTTSDSCDTDDSRPGFLQKGNTMMDLRDLLPNPSNPAGPHYEYYGLASPFREVDATAHIDYRLSDDNDLHLVGDVDFVDNIAYNAEAVFKRSQIAGLGPVNNYGPDGSYQGGNKGFLVQALVGYPVIRERLQWNFLGGYRRVETDAVVDAFNDADFHFGGTNAQGYYVQGNLGFAHNAWFNLRYFSATEVTGSPLAIDVLQLDVNARF